jgi:glucose 1-dehydrogenase/3-oxoacyl-[acyl-carrier protein] reductase
MRLKGKKALVTGASRGIGRGIAEVFADEGADVAVNYVHSSKQAEEVAKSLQAKGRKAIVVQGDVAKRADVEAMIDKAWKELGGLDILVNNAGIETIVPFLELTDDQWTQLVDINLRGAWMCSQVFCRRALAEKRKGSIVHIGSIQAAKVLPGRTHYAPTKLGLEALTRNMSAEMTPLGIRVNCVHPGLIDTDMTAWVMKSPDILPIVLAQISLGRAGQPREIGRVVAVRRVRRGELPDRAVHPRRWRVGRQIVNHALEMGRLVDWETEDPMPRLIDLSMEVSGDDDLPERGQAGHRRDGNLQPDGAERGDRQVRGDRDYQPLHDRHRRPHRDAHRFVGARQSHRATGRGDSD